MNNGFDTHELDAYTRDLISLANKKIPKESKKILKKEATKLSKKQKDTFKSLGIGQQGITEKEIVSKMKSGKVYKYNGNFTCRAYASHPLAHLLDKGYIHKGGRKHDGAETFVPGYNFIKKAEDSFRGEYFADIEQWIDNMLDEGL